MARPAVSEASILQLGQGIVFRFDDVRQRWVILAPERVLLPDEQAVEILKLVDGEAGVGMIIERLAARYTQAPRDVIAKDVVSMLQELADKGVLANG